MIRQVMASSAEEIGMKRNKGLFSNVEVDNLRSVIFEDLLENTLLALDIRSLFRCLSVCKAWHSFISSSRFRQKWQQIPRDKDDEDSWVLLSCFKTGEENPSWTDLWTSVRGISRFSPVSPDIQVVASSQGLVCARLVAECPSIFALVVGNPLTREWFRLPPLKSTLVRLWSHLHCRVQVRMKLLDCISGAYRLAITVVWHECEYNYVYHVYDSVANVWSDTFEYEEYNRENDEEYDRESDRPGRELVDFGLHHEEWITVLESNRIELSDILPSENEVLPPEAVEILPQDSAMRLLLLPPWQGICLLRHKGSLYLGSTSGLDTYSAYNIVTGMSVWEVHEDHVSKVAAVRVGIVEGNVMCVGGTNYFPCGTMSVPVMVCNLRNQSWNRINSPGEHYYSFGIAYRPSRIPLSLTINT